MIKIITGILLLGLVIVNPASANEGVTPMLKMDTTYHFMGFSQPTAAAELPGRPGGSQWGLAWTGSILGDVDGVIRWWAEFYPNPDPDPEADPVILTGVGRWEIWDCDPDDPFE